MHDWARIHIGHNYNKSHGRKAYQAWFKQGDDDKQETTTPADLRELPEWETMPGPVRAEVEQLSEGATATPLQMCRCLLFRLPPLTQ